MAKACYIIIITAAIGSIVIAFLSKVPFSPVGSQHRFPFWDLSTGGQTATLLGMSFGFILMGFLGALLGFGALFTPPSDNQLPSAGAAFGPFFGLVGWFLLSAGFAGIWRSIYHAVLVIHRL